MAGLTIFFFYQEKSSKKKENETVVDPLQILEDGYFDITPAKLSTLETKTELFFSFKMVHTLSSAQINQLILTGK